MLSGVVFFWLVSLVLGVSLIDFFRTRLGGVFTWLGGLLIGFSLISWISFVVVSLVGFSDKVVWGVMVMIAFWVVVYWFKRGGKAAKKTFWMVKKQHKIRWRWLGFWLFWLVLFGLLWSRMLVWEDDGIYAGWRTVWGDWAAHLTYTHSFLYSNNFSPGELPVYAGEKFSYPFMADFASAMLMVLGSSYWGSFLVPSLVFSMGLVLAIWLFGKVLTKDGLVSVLSVFLFLFNGGLGFLWLWTDLISNNFDLSMKLSHEYTYIDSAEIQWINIITSQVVPQRGFLMGFGLSVFCYVLFWMSMESKDRPRKLSLAGLIGMILPLIHAHSFVAVIAMGGWTMLYQLWVERKRWKRVLIHWLGFWLPMLTVGLGQIIYYYYSSVSENFIKFRIGWTSKKLYGWLIWFWVKNTGLMIIVALLGLLSEAKKRLKFFGLGFWIMFMASNLFIWQPNAFDNTKVFTHWYLMVSVLSAMVLVRLYKVEKMGAGLLASGLFVVSILAGVLDVWQMGRYELQKIRLVSNDDLVVSEWILNNTKSEALFLTGDSHNHPVPMMTGRRILLGFPGWVWSYGINYFQRQNEIKYMFTGDKNDEELIDKYKVDYVVIGPQEKSVSYGADTRYFSENYKLVFSNGSYTIYSAGE